MSKQLTYVGPHDAVDVPSLGVTVEHGKRITVEDNDVAENLAAQEGVWSAYGWKPRGEAAVTDPEPDTEGEGAE